MILSKALKYKNSLVSEISNIKEKISKHNSHLKGNISSKQFNIEKAVIRLNELITTLVNLKIAINEANRGIYPIIYMISEHKALISFWKEIDCSEGTKLVGYSEIIQTYETHMDEYKVGDIIEALQIKVNYLQDDIDEYNLTNEFHWEEALMKDDKTLKQ